MPPPLGTDLAVPSAWNTVSPDLSPKPAHVFHKVTNSVGSFKHPI